MYYQPGYVQYYDEHTCTTVQYVAGDGFGLGGVQIEFGPWEEESTGWLGT